MLLLSFMHRIGFELMYGGQKMGITTVFLPTTNFHLRFIYKKYWLI